MEPNENGVITPQFTKREEQVAERLSAGLSEKEIAYELHIKPCTVNHHTQNIREKNGLSKNSEIMLLYIAHVKKKPFSLRKIREMGISVILVMINVCDISSTGTRFL